MLEEEYLKIQFLVINGHRELSGLKGPNCILPGGLWKEQLKNHVPKLDIVFQHVEFPGSLVYKAG